MSTAERIAAYIAKWGLAAEVEPFETPSSLLSYVKAPQGPAVLKLFKVSADESNSPHVLAHYAGRGAVRVLAHDAGAVLLERIAPATALSTLVHHGRDDEATRIVCGVAAKLHASGPPPSGIPTIQDWGAGFGRHRNAPAHERLDQGLVNDAEAVFLDLCRTQGEPVLLHGDLHHDNILFDERRGWLAIDPKGVRGERAYDLPAMLRNPAGPDHIFTDPGILMRRVAIIAEGLNADRQRILRWHFAQAVLSAIWLIEDGFDDDALKPALAIAAQTRKLIGA